VKTVVTRYTTAERCAAIERLVQEWCARPEAFEHAVTETVAATGLRSETVATQLARIVEHLSAATMLDLLDAEIGDHRMLDGWVDVHGRPSRALAPRRTLHLVSGAVPGLAIESALWGMAIGGLHLVKPSHDDASIEDFLEFARQQEPELASHLDLVDEIVWTHYDAAVVYGSDRTIELVRRHLGQTAAVAAFGARDGLAVVTSAGMNAIPDWAAQVAQDVARFDAAGCMTPRRLVVVGTMDDALRAQQLLDAAIEEHRDRTFARRTAIRRDIDARMLAAVAVRTGTDPTESSEPLPSSDHTSIVDTVDVLAVASIAELIDALYPPWQLQTASIICAPDELETLCDALAHSGCTRLCQPGAAHEPSALWRHDGRGRIIDLIRFVERDGI
jgi:hypothetical protein